MKNSSMPVPPSDAQLYDAPGLEFPVRRGLAPHRGRMTFERAVWWNEEMMAKFSPKLNRAAPDADLKCVVEFRLL
jgi:hypothetical protein